MMDSANMNILYLALGLISLVIMLALLFLLNRLGGGSKNKTAQRLEKIKGRFAPGVKPIARGEKSIRLQRPETGLMAYLGAFVPRRDYIKARLERAGLSMDVSKYGLLAVAVAVGSFMVFASAQFSAGFSFVAALLLGFMVPHEIVNRLIKRRLARFTAQFPEAVDLMVRGLKSGLPVNECIASVGREVTAPTGTEFQKITNAMKLGKTLEEALWDVADRLDTPDFKFFVISLSVQRETGGNLAETLSNLSTILRQRQQMKLKVRALSSEAKASAWIMGVLPFVMYGLIMMMNPEYGSILYTHPTAIAISIGGLVWMSLGVFVMSRMIQFEV